MALLDVMDIQRLSAHAVLLKRKWTTLGHAKGADIMGPIWMLTQIRIAGPAVWWTVDGRKVMAENPESFVAFFPPYSWAVEHAKPGTQWDMTSILSMEALPKAAPKYPCLLRSTESFPASTKEVPSFFERSTIATELSVCTKPSVTAQRIKEHLDKGFADDISLEEIAKKMKSSSAYLSRQFKAAYGYSPNHYKKRLKISVATFALTIGKSPADAASMAGYGDLGRFYKQFGELMHTTPRKHQGSG